jgi:hypothetical protein
MHAAEPTKCGDELVTEKLKKYKSPGYDIIPG